MGKLRNDPKLRKMYLSYQNDGVLDVFLGWCLFLAGLMMFTEIFWMAGAYVALITPMMWSFKETVTVPRLRRDELESVTGRRVVSLRVALVGGLLGLAILGLVALVLLAGDVLTGRVGHLILTFASGVVAAAVLGGFVLVGYMCRAPRWYAYAGLAIIMAVLARAASIDLPWVIMAAGAIIAMTGTIYLFRFLRSHPLLPINQQPNW